MKLSRNFSLDELTLSQTAERTGINNAPPTHVILNLVRLASALEEVRELVRRPVMVSSGYRSKELNTRIGGSQTSAHVKGLAADINCPGMTPAALAATIKTSSIDFDQLILEFDRWVHIGLSEGEPRRQLLTIRRGTGYMKGIV